MSEEAVEALAKVVTEAEEDIVLTDHVQDRYRLEEQTRNTEVQRELF